MKLEGKVAIITGGGQGIGEGIIRCLAKEGADIAVVDINSETTRKIADEVKAMGRKALPIVADLTDDKEVTRVVDEAVDFFGKIDILVNNVGGGGKDLAEIMQKYRELLSDESLPSYMYFSSEVWDGLYRLNLKSHVMMSHAVTPYFIKQKSGKIVNIASIAGRLPDPNEMPYAAAKAGDISITWSMARALAPYNVTVNCVCPGLVYTPLWDRMATGMYEQLRDAIAAGKTLPPNFQGLASKDIDIDKLTPKEFWLRFMVGPSVPLGREQTPEDMGDAVVFFVSEDARNITGQVLHVDGGQVMR